MADNNRNKRESSYMQEQDWDDYDRGRSSYGEDRNYGDDKRRREQGNYMEGQYDRYPEYNREDSGNYGSRRRKRYGRDYESDYGTTDYRGGRTGYRGYDMGYASPYYGYGSPYSGTTHYGRDYNRAGSGNRGVGVRGFDGNRAYGDRSFDDYRNEVDRSYNDRDRDWWDRTRDEVSSWFGDDEAERRRRMDRVYGQYRGKGPRGYRRADERIREDINDRLSDDPFLDASEVDVSIENGEVTLTGSVDSRMSKRRAEDIAESVSGVTNVENRLRVGTHYATEVDEVSVGSEQHKRKTHDK